MAHRRELRASRAPGGRQPGPRVRPAPRITRRRGRRRDSGSGRSGSSRNGAGKRRRRCERPAPQLGHSDSRLVAWNGSLGGRSVAHHSRPRACGAGRVAAVWGPRAPTVGRGARAGVGGGAGGPCDAPLNYRRHTPTPPSYRISVPNGAESSARCSIIFRPSSSGAIRGVPRRDLGACQLSSIG